MYMVNTTKTKGDTHTLMFMPNIRAFVLQIPIKVKINISVLFRHAMFYLAEQFCHAMFSLAELFRHVKFHFAGQLQTTIRPLNHESLIQLDKSKATLFDAILIQVD